ncbi:long-chain-fatty-acid--CoA ligase [Actinoplanes cyaneus]|uniref:Long-chain-fatty-acid--CoA ligase n=1 Tax=Actinoplanes cyaneus TaxID=52696 RepID=A0A919MCU2_9ACTN|nr:class I adenylate-forming enzyme family protein [Actinoplanes cyaneus]MCW2144258.1 Acyl-CoA synthetase (AMP-forming)/AMP-acid ligase II [Actinoplanes cyaneus]GID71029.1 long-chain-fatty-acid--CoA ligase [Actinoplanes cyaneus]
MADIVEAVRSHGNDRRPAIISDDRTTTYQELVELIGRLAGGLGKRLTADDVCLVISHPRLEESVALTLAGWSLGLRVAVLPPYLKDRELSHVLEQCAPVVTVSDTSADSPDSIAFASLLDAAPGGFGSNTADAWLETFTSGTTGRSKCVDRRVSRLSADIEQLALATGFTAADTVTAMTTALSTTSVLPALVAGATVATIGLQSGRQFWQAIQERQITVVSGTPYAYEFAVRKTPEPAQLRHVRMALTTSARLRPGTARQFMDQTGIAIRNIMCSSESGHVAYNDADDPEILATSVGRPLPGVEVEIRAADGSVLPAGESGRICVRSPFTATRYRNRPDATAETFQGDWVISTDVGYLDDKGFLRLTGRDDHKIHFGAAKLDPQEIEDVLISHPAVGDALVEGETHGRLGQVPVARVVLTGQVSAPELLAYCREQVSPTKVPQRIEFVDSIAKDFKGQPVRPKNVRFA